MRYEQASPDRFGRQHSEQVEISGLFVLERAHLVPGPARGAEYLEPAAGLDQAKSAVDRAHDMLDRALASTSSPTA